MFHDSVLGHSSHGHSRQNQKSDKMQQHGLPGPKGEKGESGMPGEHGRKGETGRKVNKSCVNYYASSFTVIKYKLEIWKYG